MRYATSAVIAAWTAGMAVVFGWGLYILGWTLKVTVIDGKPILRCAPVVQGHRLVSKRGPDVVEHGP
jgi:beta-phosphoglucomutase-like phosphatase (HAD superfamily)